MTPPMGPHYAVLMRRALHALFACLVVLGQTLGPVQAAPVADADPMVIPVTDPDSVVTVHQERRFGHGVGMSQYGARGRARAGQTAGQILAAYYPGTTLGGNAGGSVRVRLTPTLRPAILPPDPTPVPTLMPTWTPTALVCPTAVPTATPTRMPIAVVTGTPVVKRAPAQLPAMITPAPCPVAAIPRPVAPEPSVTPAPLVVPVQSIKQSAIFARGGSATVLLTGTTVPQDGALVLWTSAAGPLASVMDATGTELARMPATDGVAISTNRGILEAAGLRYRGQLWASADGGLTNILDVESYLLGVVGPEMGSGSPYEALRAQAIASRSYALGYGGTLTDTDVSQVYGGVTSETADVANAVRSTIGVVVLANGVLARTLFHSCSQYHTLANQTVWPGPATWYLQGILDVSPDGYPYAAPCPGTASSTMQVTARTIRDAVRWDGLGTPLHVDLLWEQDRLTGATLVGSGGKISLDATAATQAFGALGIDRTAIRAQQWVEPPTITPTGTPTPSPTSSAIAIPVPPTSPTPVGDESRVFPDTGQMLHGAFLRRWSEGGGQVTFGLPISPEFVEDGMVVQYFERAEFQWVPGRAPETDDVLLALLGSHAFGPPAPAATPITDAQFANETGHNVSDIFLTAYNILGGLDRFGFPLDESHTGPDGTTVQYFQRGRLERPAWNDIVSPGAMGSEAYLARYTRTPTPTPTYTATPPSTATRGGTTTATTSPTATETSTATSTEEATATTISTATTTPTVLVGNKGPRHATNGSAVGEVIEAIRVALGLAHKSGG